MTKHFRTNLFFSFLLALVFLPGQMLKAQTNNPSAKWENEIRAYEKKDLTNPPPQGAILFVGSSTIRKWKTLAEDFPGKQVINRGFGGSQIADSTAFADRIVIPYVPKTVVLYAGDNDLAAGKSVDQVVKDYRAFVEKVHSHLPNTRIFYISIKPCPARWKLRDKVAAVNEQIKGMKDTELGFIDIAPIMLTAEGKPRKELFEADGLHPNRECYKIWSGIIAPVLEH